MSIPFFQFLMDEFSHISYTKLSNVAHLYIYILVTPIHMAYLHIYIYTVWLFNIAMERSTIFKFGKASISFRAIYTIWLR